MATERRINRYTDNDEEKENVKVKVKKKEKIEDKKSGNEIEKLSTGYIILIVLVALEILMIPILIFSGIKKPIPIVMFLVLPFLSVLIIYLLVRSILKEDKKNKVKININTNLDSFKEEDEELRRVEVTKRRIRGE